MYCILEHADKCGLEHFGKILKRCRCLVRMTELRIHRTRHKVIVSRVQHSIQLDMAQEKSFVMLIQC